MMKYLALILCLALVGCGSMGQAGKERKLAKANREAIQKVLSARSDIRQVISHIPQNDAELLGANHDPSVLVFKVSDYVVRLRAIPLKGCPPDFQAAFVNYVEAWNARAAANPGLILILAGGPGTHSENDPDAVRRTEITWRDLQTVVTKYMTESPAGN